MENTKKREGYKSPSIELLEFESGDVITTSGFFGDEDEFGDRDGRTVFQNSGSSSYETPSAKLDG